MVSLPSASGSVSPLVETPFQGALVSTSPNVSLGAKATGTRNCGFCFKCSLRWAFICGGSKLLKIASYLKSFILLFSICNATSVFTLTIEKICFSPKVSIQPCRSKSDSVLPGAIWTQFRPRKLYQKAIPAHGSAHFSPRTKLAQADWTVLALI